MTGVSIHIDSRALQSLQKTLASLSTLDLMLDQIGGHLVSETARRFVEGVDPKGNAWEPSQRALEQGGKTLVNQGHLRDSITYLLNGGTVEVGTDLVYGAIQQFGGVTGRNHATTLPARPFLGINAGDEVAIADIAQNYIASLMS